MKMQSGKSRKLVLILLLALAVRAGLLVASLCADPDGSGLFTVDSVGYENLSRSIAEDGRFDQYGQAELFRTPGYPLLLAAMRVFGGHYWLAASIVQILLDVLLVYLTFVLGRMISSERVGLWAAAFQAVSLVSAVFCLRILSDSVYALLLTVSIILFIRHWRTGGLLPLVGFAVVAAAGCYVRPVGMAFAALACLFLAGRAARRLLVCGSAGELRGLAALAIAVVIIAAAIVPWVVRNGQEADYYGFSDVACEGGCEYQAPAVISVTENVTFMQGRELFAQRMNEELAGRNMTRGEIIRYKTGRVHDLIMEHPWVYLKLHVAGLRAVWMPAAPDMLEVLGATVGGRGTLEILWRDGLVAAARYYFHDRMWAIWIFVPAAILVFFKLAMVVVAVACRLRLRMKAEHWLMLLTVLVLTLPPGPAGHARFRVPAEPLLNVAAGVGIILVFAAFGRLRRRGQASPTATAD